jgi:hypothetical protein
MKTMHLAAAILAATAITPATAATFTSSFGFGGPPPAGEYCNINTNTTAFATGNVLGYSPQSCEGGFTVALDTAAQTITLTNIVGSDFGNYEYAQLEITGISEVTITSLSTLQYLPIFDPSALSFATLTPAPQLSFTGSSILIVFDTVGSGQFNFGGDGGQAIFAYNSGAVPEPASWAMMIAGFGLVGAAMRRRALAAA